MIKIRCSSLGKIMSPAKSKKPKDLSAGALTHCYELSKQFVYGYSPQISSRAIDKGILCEDQSIALYNSVFFTSYKKNSERRENAYLTGECDIFGDGMVTDIKTSFSLETFPAIPSRIDSKLYEWQLRGYMILWNSVRSRLAYCMIDTPSDLCQYDDESLHMVSHIDPSLRVTIKDFDFDQDKSDLIKIKCQAAQIQIERFIEDIATEHSEL